MKPSAAPGVTASDNPFATEHIVAGRIPFKFREPDGTLHALVDRFLFEGRCAQILGPCGTGKSTLIVQSALELERRRFRVSRVHLDREGMAAYDPIESPEEQILCVDGMDRVWRPVWWLLRPALRTAYRGLLVTTHRDLGLPTLYRTEANLETARWVVARLDGDRAAIADEELRELLSGSRGDLRQLLLTLYDRAAARQPAD